MTWPAHLMHTICSGLSAVSGFASLSVSFKNSTAVSTATKVLFFPPLLKYLYTHKPQVSHFPFFDPRFKRVSACAGGALAEPGRLAAWHSPMPTVGLAASPCQKPIGRHAPCSGDRAQRVQALTCGLLRFALCFVFVFPCDGEGRRRQVRQAAL